MAPRYVVVGFRPGRPLLFDLLTLPVISAVVGINGTSVQIPASAMRALLRSTGSGLNAPATHRFMQTHYELPRAIWLRPSMVDLPASPSR